MTRAILVVSLMLAAVPALAEPMKPEARARLDSGLGHFSAKEWDAAIEDFRAGYAMDPQGDFLYAWAQVERLRGNCAEAVKLYERYLASGVTAEQAKVTADNIGKCHASGLADTSTPAARAPTVNAPPPSTGAGGALSSRSDKSSPSSWTSDTTGHILLGSGLACLAASTFLFLDSASEASAAPDATTYAAYDDHLSAARTRRTIAIVTLGAGAALATSGVLHYLLAHPRAEVSAYVGPGGGGLALAGRF